MLLVSLRLLTLLVMLILLNSTFVSNAVTIYDEILRIIVIIRNTAGFQHDQHSENYC